MPDTPTSNQADELFCPQCGYNLRGIPEDRCPECGFGYQRAAIVEVATISFERRLWTCHRIVLFATISLLCSLLTVSSHDGKLGWYALGALLLIAFFAIEFWLIWCANGWASLGDRFPRSPWNALATLFFVLFVSVGLAFPVLTQVAAAVSLLLPFTARGAVPACFRSAGLSLPKDKQRRLRRWQVTACVAVSFALAVLIFVDVV